MKRSDCYIHTKVITIVLRNAYKTKCLKREVMAHRFSKIMATINILLYYYILCNHIWEISTGKKTADSKFKYRTVIFSFTVLNFGDRIFKSVVVFIHTCQAWGFLHRVTWDWAFSQYHKSNISARKNTVILYSWFEILRCNHIYSTYLMSNTLYMYIGSFCRQISRTQERVSQSAVSSIQ